MLKSIQFGLRYDDRFGCNRADWGGAISCYGNTDQIGFDPAVQNSTACGNGAGETPWFAGAWQNSHSGFITKAHGSFFDGEKPWGIRQWMNANPDWTQANIVTLREAFGQPDTSPPTDLSNSFDDREQSFTAYVMGNYDFLLGPDAPDRRHRRTRR